MRKEVWDVESYKRKLTGSKQGNQFAEKVREELGWGWVVSVMTKKRDRRQHLREKDFFGESGFLNFWETGERNVFFYPRRWAREWGKGTGNGDRGRGRKVRGEKPSAVGSRTMVSGRWQGKLEKGGELPREKKIRKEKKGGLSAVTKSETHPIDGHAGPVEGAERRRRGYGEKGGFSDVAQEKRPHHVDCGSLSEGKSGLCQGLSLVGLVPSAAGGDEMGAGNVGEKKRWAPISKGSL